jgi:hypothetical protein
MSNYLAAGARPSRLTDWKSRGNLERRPHAGIATRRDEIATCLRDQRFADRVRMALDQYPMGSKIPTPDAHGVLPCLSGSGLRRDLDATPLTAHSASGHQARSQALGIGSPGAANRPETNPMGGPGFRGGSAMRSLTQRLDRNLGLATTLRRSRYRDRRQVRYRLGRAHPWPGGLRTRWTTNRISWSHHKSSNPNRPAGPGRTLFPILRGQSRFDGPYQPQVASVPRLGAQNVPIGTLPLLVSLPGRLKGEIGSTPRRRVEKTLDLRQVALDRRQ